MTQLVPDTIENVRDYLEKVDKFSRYVDPDEFFVFRGQSKDWECLPRIASTGFLKSLGLSCAHGH